MKANPVSIAADNLPCQPAQYHQRILPVEEIECRKYQSTHFRTSQNTQIPRANNHFDTSTLRWKDSITFTYMDLTKRTVIFLPFGIIENNRNYITLTLFKWTLCYHTWCWRRYIGAQVILGWSDTWHRLGAEVILGTSSVSHCVSLMHLVSA